MHFGCSSSGLNPLLPDAISSGLLGSAPRLHRMPGARLAVSQSGFQRIGRFLIAVSILVFPGLTYGAPGGHGQAASNESWGGATLEWSVPSPPPVYNFSVHPTVPRAGCRVEDGSTTSRCEIPRPPPRAIHVPGGSWALVAACGLPVMAPGVDAPRCGWCSWGLRSCCWHLPLGLRALEV